LEPRAELSSRLRTLPSRAAVAGNEKKGIVRGARPARLASRSPGHDTEKGKWKRGNAKEEIERGKRKAENGKGETKKGQLKTPRRKGASQSGPRSPRGGEEWWLTKRFAVGLPASQPERKIVLRAGWFVWREFGVQRPWFWYAIWFIAKMYVRWIDGLEEYNTVPEVREYTLDIESRRSFSSPNSVACQDEFHTLHS
jgi:hypothetical protein